VSVEDKIFLNLQIDIADPELGADNSAFSVDRLFPALKLQFLFTFLNISHIFVCDCGDLVGIITKEEFIKKATLLS